MAVQAIAGALLSGAGSYLSAKGKEEKTKVTYHDKPITQVARNVLAPTAFGNLNQTGTLFNNQLSSATQGVADQSVAQGAVGPQQLIDQLATQNAGVVAKQMKDPNIARETAVANSFGGQGGARSAQFSKSFGDLVGFYGQHANENLQNQTNEVKATAPEILSDWASNSLGSFYKGRVQGNEDAYKKALMSQQLLQSPSVQSPSVQSARSGSDLASKYPINLPK